MILSTKIALSTKICRICHWRIFYNNKTLEITTISITKKDQVSYIPLESPLFNYWKLSLKIMSQHGKQHVKLKKINSTENHKCGRPKKLLKIRKQLWGKRLQGICIQSWVVFLASKTKNTGDRNPTIHFCTSQALNTLPYQCFNSFVCPYSKLYLRDMYQIY